MKSIVEGMKMDWSYQSRKLNSDKLRWGVAVIAIPSLDPNNKITCIPLRKLFGWLQTLQPNRVRTDIRDAVIQYQNECDDVLWQYWSQEHKNPIMPIQASKRMRLLMNMENGHVVSTSVVPSDSMVFSSAEIPNLLREPGLFSVEDYVEIAKVANERLAEIVKGNLVY